ncbi:SET domain-containing protein [Mycena rebaudengoi]|nr:SET domain-containing protein [Mycena rebaudengoi]
MSQDDRSEKIEGPQKRRESARPRRSERQESPIAAPVDDPPLSLPPLQPTRSPLFFAPLDTPPNVIKPRREIIQDQWNKIAREAGAAGIEFVNEVDDEEVPPGIGILFPYVERSYLFDIGTAEPTALAGCECDGKSGCNNARPGRCPCASASSTLKNRPAYTQVRLNLIYIHTSQGVHTCLNFQGLFAFNTESEIVECNSACGCSPQCNNRLVQFPRQIPAQIFKTEKRGWGARLPVDIVRGQVVGLYTGRREEADKLSGSRASYCFDLDVNEDPDEETPENAYSVDAYGCGNWTRFINHSCSPNLQIISVVYDAMPEDNMPYLALVATENIPAFTELTFDYNPAHQTEWELKRYREKTRSKKNKSKKQTRCLCGASICRGWLSVVA